MFTRAPMKKTSLTSAALLAFALVAQTQVIPGVYQIVSGTYFDEGGFGGENVEALPRKSQMFISLFGHSGVTAILTPVLTIRVTNGVDLCWGTTANRTYQAYYSADLRTNSWMSLGSSVSGTGSTICVHDSVLLSDQQRFYRVAI